MMVGLTGCSERFALRLVAEPKSPATFVPNSATQPPFFADISCMEDFARKRKASKAAAMITMRELVRYLTKLRFEGLIKAEITKKSAHL